MPKGYFGIFHEVASILVPMIRSGVMISDKVIPDISIGMSWSGYWGKNGLEEKYGPTTTYEHEYPPYYPQAESNPQTAKAYPNAALGEFREWLEDTYIIKQFPRYLYAKQKQKHISITTAEKAIGAFSKKELK